MRNPLDRRPEADGYLLNGVSYVFIDKERVVSIVSF